MKFLIIRFSSIGDIVLTTPVIRCLKKQLPDAEIHYLTKHNFKSIISSNPYVDKIFTLGLSWEILMYQLKSEDYDFVIDLHNNLRTWRIKKELRIKSASFSKLNIKKWIYTNLKWNVMPSIHIVDRYLKTVEEFGIINDEEGLNYFLSDNDFITENDIPVSHQAGYIGIVIGAAHTTKKLPINKLKILCDMIDHPIILLGGPEDRNAGDIISAGNPIKIYNACGKFSLNESADLVRGAKLIITHDTGLMHIAAALKKPIISIWGNTTPAFGMYPYYGKKHLENKSIIPFALIEVKNLSCRPCSKIGYKKCPKIHFKCMEHISEENILEKVKEYLTTIDKKSKAFLGKT